MFIQATDYRDENIIVKEKCAFGIKLKSTLNSLLIENSILSHMLFL